MGTVWTLKDGKPEAVSVKVGLTDGVMTEVEGADVTEGMEVIVGEQASQQTAASGGTNPFAPQMFRGGGGGRPGGGSGTGGTGSGGGARPAGGGGR